MNKQIIWLYTLSFNESHFVKNFLTAYKDVDRIIVNDNMSTDNTVELLKQDPRVEVRTWDSKGQIRDDMYLDYKNNVWKEARGKADWVIVVDFDEIFTSAYLKDNKPIFDLDLYDIYKDGYNMIKPRGYNMVSLNSPLGTDNHPYEHSKIGVYHPPEEKLVCFRPDRLSEIRYHAGCHHAQPLDLNGTTDNIKIYNYGDFKILHYKWWDIELYIKKMGEGIERMSDVNKKFNWGWHYMKPLDEHRVDYIRGYDLSKNLFDIETPSDK